MLFLTTLIYNLFNTLISPTSAAQAPTTPASENIRTLRDIVVSCLTTIFACTWVSLHPNVPALRSNNHTRSFWCKTWGSIRRFVRRDLPTFVVALLFPEYIIGWAIMQRMVAVSYVKLIDDPHFTITHAFLVIMGGIHKKIEDGSFPLDRLQVAALLGMEVDPSKWVMISKGGKALIELPSEAELQDKGKSDWLAKLVVLIQTFWFIIQCVARSIERLPITQLEVVTFAYAVLNFAIYIAWWDKPSRVSCPVLITAEVMPEREKERDSFVSFSIFYIMGYPIDDHGQLNNQTEVTIFYSGEPDRQHVFIATFVSFILGAVVGAIHCIDWCSTFTTPMEQRMWQISSLLLTFLPFAGVVAMGAGRFYDSDRNNIWDRVMLWTSIPLWLASPLLLVGYLVARFSTFFIAFHSFQSLPPDALIAVQWTSLIPHI